MYSLLNNASSDRSGFLVKLDSNGSFKWGQQIDSTLASVAYSVTIDSFDNIYMGGAYQGTVDFDRTTSIFNLTSNGQYDAYLEKLGPDGSFKWAKSWGGSSVDDVKKIVVGQN